MENQELKWVAHEYAYKEKGRDWYWAIGIIGASIAVTAILFGNFTFGVLVIVAIFTLCLFAARRPFRIEVVLDGHGIHAGEKLYPYEEVESFFVEDQTPQHTLIIKMKRVTVPFVSILIENTDPQEIKNFLAQILPEVEHTEPILQKIMEYFGF